MKRQITSGIISAALLLVLSATASAQYKVSSQQTVGGFVHVESVSYDPAAKALYLSEFGTEKLDPLLKDGNGRIVKTDLFGKVVDKQFLPGPRGEKLNKPKGNWVKGNRFWVTDIDVAWVFDLKTKKGRKVALPGATFANDSAVMDGALYVSDNRSDQIFKIEPADFCVVPSAGGLTVVVPDLVQGQLRFVQLRK